MVNQTNSNPSDEHRAAFAFVFVPMATEKPNRIVFMKK